MQLAFDEESFPTPRRSNRPERSAYPDASGAPLHPSSQSSPPRDRLHGAPDDELIRLTQRGDVEAYGILVERYRRKAYFGALAWVGDREEALDLTQEAFARGYQAVSRFDTSLPFYPWLYRILRNLCFTWLRKTGGKRPVSLSASGPDDDSPAIEIPDARFDPGTILSRSEVSETVWKSINELPVKDREIIVLNHFLELSYQEIADTLGIPIGTVMSRLFYARKRLKERLGVFVSSQPEE